VKGTKMESSALTRAHEARHFMNFFLLHNFSADFLNLSVS
jgi:hypothetical protein